MPCLFFSDCGILPERDSIYLCSLPCEYQQLSCKFTALLSHQQSSYSMAHYRESKGNHNRWCDSNTCGYHLFQITKKNVPSNARPNTRTSIRISTSRQMQLNFVIVFYVQLIYIYTYTYIHIHISRITLAEWYGLRTVTCRSRVRFLPFADESQKDKTGHEVEFSLLC